MELGAPGADRATPLLLDLGPLFEGVLVQRPSSLCKTPYVADVDLGGGVMALAHCPGLDGAGMLKPGDVVLMTARKAGAGRTTHSLELLRDRSLAAPIESGSTVGPGAVVGSNPALAERLVKSALEKEAVPEVGTGYTVEQQKTYGGCRVDFVLTYEDGSKLLLEVKNVMCADHPLGHQTAEKGRAKAKKAKKEAAAAADSAAAASGGGSTDAPAATATAATAAAAAAAAAAARAALSSAQAAAEAVAAAGGAFQRAAIFPHGSKKPGLGVVSDRAIKHVHELTEIHATREGEHENVSAAIMFLVNRDDCCSFRPCHECDPLFAQVLRRAERQGVRLLAYPVTWDGGRAFLREKLPIRFDEAVGEVDEEWLERVLKFNASGGSEWSKSASKKAKEASAAAPASSKKAKKEKGGAEPKRTKKEVKGKEGSGASGAAAADGVEASGKGRKRKGQKQEEQGGGTAAVVAAALDAQQEPPTKKRKRKGDEVQGENGEAKGAVVGDSNPERGAKRRSQKDEAEKAAPVPVAAVPTAPVTKTLRRSARKA